MAEIDDMVGGPQLDEIVKGATRVPGANIDIDAMVKDQAKISREGLAAKDEVRGRTVNRLNQDAEDAREKMQGVEQIDVQPWDADKEMSQRQTSPLDSFGSFGSVFAIAASAFTRQPMVNALNGSAAAMNAIKDRDEKGYEKAYKAWKDNIDLAMKRHQVQQQAYSNAIAMFGVDQSAGTAELKAVAEQFGDKSASAMLDAGYMPQFFELDKSRQSAYKGILDSRPQIEHMYLERKAQTLKQKPDKTDDDLREITAIEERLNIRRTADQEIIRAAKEEDPRISSDDLAKKVRESRRELTPAQKAVERLLEQKPEATAEEIASVAKSATGGGAGVATVDRKILADAEKESSVTGEPVSKIVGRMRTEAAKKNPEGGATQRAAGIREQQDKMERETGKRPTIAEAEKQYNLTARSVPSANRMDDINRQVAQYDHSIDLFDKALDILEEKSFVAGLGGRAGRLKERVGNVLGTNDDTDRVQFMRYLNELKMHAPQLLADRSGRPMAAEIKKVDDVIAGISSGDTTANTIRALEELRTTYRQNRRTNIKRREGQPIYDAAGESTAAPEKTGTDEPAKKPAWQSAPLAKDR